MQWNQTLPGITANQVIATIDGGYALAVEYSNAFGLVKIDSCGNIVFNEVFNGPKIKLAREPSYKQTMEVTQLVDGSTAALMQLEHGLLKPTRWTRKCGSQTYMGLAGYGLTRTVEGGATN